MVEERLEWVVVQGPHPGITGYMGGGPWTLLCIQWPPPGQYAVRGTACRAPSSAGCLRTSMEAAWCQRGIRGSLMGNPEIPEKFSEHSGDHW